MNWMRIAYVGQGKGWNLSSEKSKTYSVNYFAASHVAQTDKIGAVYGNDVIVIEEPRTPRAANSVFRAIEKLRTTSDTPIIYVASEKPGDELPGKLQKSHIHFAVGKTRLLRAEKNNVTGRQTPAIAKIVDGFRLPLSAHSTSNWGGYYPEMRIDLSVPGRVSIHHYDPSRTDAECTLNLRGFWPHFLVTELQGKRLCGEAYLFDKARETLGKRCSDPKIIAREVAKLNDQLSTIEFDEVNDQESLIHRKGRGFLWNVRTLVKTEPTPKVA